MLLLRRNQKLIPNLSLRSLGTRVEPNHEDIEDKFKKCQEKLLFSSYLDALELKLGYVKNKILAAKLEKQEKLEARTIKPFPLALKYMMDETPEPVKETTHEEDMDEVTGRKFFIPYRQARSTVNPLPANWMTDYEWYDDTTNEGRITADPLMPVSNVPCPGCGAHLHCADTAIPGFLPKEVFKGRSHRELTRIPCQRCHLLKNYNTAINVTVTPDDYVKVISGIRDQKALAVLMIDLLDMENSIWPGLIEVLGRRRPILVVGNKVDLLPRDFPGHLDHVRKCVQKAVMDAGFDEENIRQIALISATTGFGVESLITKIHNVWGRQGDVYIVGCTNVGKSSLFNTLLQSDFCKSEASNIIQRATASPWPGTTLNLLKFPILRPSDFRLALRTIRLKKDDRVTRDEEKLRRLHANETGKIADGTLVGHIGRTFVPSKPTTEDPFGSHLGTPREHIDVVDAKNEKYRDSSWCFDTPGVVQPEQILNLLTTEELLKVLPRRMIVPRTYVFRRGMSLFVAGLARIDYLDGLDWIRVQVYASSELPTAITRTEDADEVYQTCLGTDILGVPLGSEERITEFPALKSVDVEVTGMDKSVLSSDILLSSTGWLGVSMPEGFTGTFRVWTPEGRGISVRRPALVPYGIQLRGKRIRGSYAYRMKTPFIRFKK